jgi:hypothetical protein
MNRRHEPLDADERALAALLAREESPGPSPQLDARILAAAHAAAAPVSRRPQRRWIAGLGIAASLLLAVGIAWRLRPLPQRPMANEAPVAVRVSAAASADVSRRAAREQARMAPPSAPIAEPVPVEAAKRAIPDARVASPPPEPRVVVDQPEPMDAAAPPPQAFPAPPPPPAAQPAMSAAAPAANVSGEMAKQTRAQKPAETLDRIETTGSRIDAAAAADAAASGMALPSRAELDDEPPATADSPLVQEAWLQRIRELLSAGEVDTARNSLAEFRRRYPDYALPDDLRHLARP